MASETRSMIQNNLDNFSKQDRMRTVQNKGKTNYLAFLLFVFNLFYVYIYAVIEMQFYILTIKKNYI